GESDLALPLRFLLLELANLLVDGGDFVRLAIEAFVPMAAHASAQTENLAALVQRVRHLRDGFARVALLAAGLDVLLMVQRPQPELVVPMRFFGARKRSPVAAVARRAAEALGIVNLQQLFVRMS